jgi:hypothetical protein
MASVCTAGAGRSGAGASSNDPGCSPSKTASRWRCCASSRSASGKADSVSFNNASARAVSSRAAPAGGHAEAWWFQTAFEQLPLLAQEPTVFAGALEAEIIGRHFREQRHLHITELRVCHADFGRSGFR